MNIWQPSRKPGVVNDSNSSTRLRGSVLLRDSRCAMDGSLMLKTVGIVVALAVGGLILALLVICAAQELRSL